MKIIMLALLLFNSLTFAAETCSRVAIVNYQKVLVDASSNKKGEGLRFYLEKDQTSKELLDEYQEVSSPTILSASSSTAGSLMILTGLLQSNDDSGLQNTNTLIYGGLGLIALSYVISKTRQYNNEKILKQAVDIYNTRNTPKIYFSPYKNNNGTSSIGFGFQQEF